MNKKQVIELEQIVDIIQAHELFDFLIDTNKKKFNFTKLAEELTELNELCLKYVNKHKEFKPTKDKFIEEIGDVLLRIHIINKKLDITDDQIKDRIIFKANKFLQYVKEGKYDRGI